MVQLIGALLQLLFLIFSKWGEMDREKREKKRQLQKELTDAIAAKDTSAITSTIDSINRMR